MKPSDELFQLIKTLSPSEKRYVTMMLETFKIGKGQSKSLLLFNVLKKQSDYDEAKLKPELEDHFSASHLSFEKNNLYNHILKCLRNFNHQKPVQYEIMEGMEEISILFSKALYEQCIKRIDRNLKLASTYEMNTLHYEILKWKRKALNVMMPKNYAELLEENKKEVLAVLEKVNVENEFVLMHDEMLQILRQNFALANEKNKELARQLMNNALLGDINFAITFSAKLYFLRIYTYYSMLYGDISKCVEHLQAILKLWESNPKIKNAYLNEFFTDTINYLNCCKNIGFFEPYPHYLALLKKIEPENERQAVDFFKHLTTIELLWLMNTCKLKEAVELVPGIEEKLLKYKPGLTTTFYTQLCHNISIIFFMVGDYRQSLKWNKKVFESDDLSIRNDIQGFARVLHLVLQFELNNDEIMESLIRSAERYTTKGKERTPVESLLIRFMKKVCISGVGFNKEIEKVYPQVEQLYQKQKNLTGAEETYIWFKSKKTGASKTEVLQELAGVEE